MGGGDGDGGGDGGDGGDGDGGGDNGWWWWWWGIQVAVVGVYKVVECIYKFLTLLYI